jgi:hypothetical protein
MNPFLANQFHHARGVGARAAAARRRRCYAAACWHATHQWRPGTRRPATPTAPSRAHTGGPDRTIISARHPGARHSRSSLHAGGGGRRAGCCGCELPQPRTCWLARWHHSGVCVCRQPRSLCCRARTANLRGVLHCSFYTTQRHGAQRCDVRRHGR